MKFESKQLEDGKNPRLTGERARVHRRLKAYKEREGLARVKLREDVNMDRVEMLSKRALVGRLKHVKLNRGELNKFWVPKVGYASLINLLINGWLIFIFSNEYKQIKIPKKLAHCF